MPYASGRMGRRICDRCGFDGEYKSFSREQGTGWIVCSVCNDGRFNLVTHPQNKPPFVGGDPYPLENPRQNTPIGIDINPVDEDQIIPIQPGGN